MPKKFIPATDPAIRYMGRIDRTVPDAPKIVWAGSMITLRFVGRDLSAVICDHRFYNKIELGRRMGNRYEVRSGVQDGDLVVTAGYTKLSDGMEVEEVE